MMRSGAASCYAATRMQMQDGWLLVDCRSSLGHHLHTWHEQDNGINNQHECMMVRMLDMSTVCAHPELLLLAGCRCRLHGIGWF